MNDGVGGLEGDVVAEEEMCGGVGGAPDELGDLEDCEGAFEGGGDAVVEGAEGVVGVLKYPHLSVTPLMMKWP